MLGVVKLVEVVSGLPPTLALYHRTVVPPLPDDAVRVVDPDPQTGGAEVMVGAEGNVVQFTVTFNVLRVVPNALKLIEEAPAKTHFTLA